MPTTKTKAKRKTKKARIVINSLGECYRSVGNGEGVPLGSGSINVTEVAGDALYAGDFNKYMKCKHGTPEDVVMRRYVQKCISHKFLEDAYHQMKLPVFGFYQVVGDLQKQNDSRFRVWAEMLGESFKSTQHIWLVTEFAWWVDDPSFWAKLHAMANSCGFEVDTMFEEPHSDQYWKEGVNGHAKDAPLVQKTAVTGENHGRMERQVEVRIDLAKGVDPYNLDMLKKRCDEARIKMAKASESIWKKSGVGVI